MIGLAEHAHPGGIERDFLPRLAQRGGGGVLAIVDAPPGKGNLPAMIAQALAAVGEDQPGLGPVGDRHQHRGVAQRAVGRLVMVAGEQIIGTRAGQRRREALDQAHCGASAKKAPFDHRPGGSCPSASAISASS